MHSEAQQGKARMPPELDVNTDLSAGVDKVERGSVRESIEQAVDQHREDSPENAQLAKSIENKRNSIREQRNEAAELVATSDSDDSEPVTTTSRDDNRDVTTSNTPDNIPAELKAHWDKLSPVMQNYIQKHDKELVQVRQELERTNQLKEVEQVFDDYMPEYKDIGPKFKAQMVSKLFDWLGRLGNPDINKRVAALEELAYSFRINLAEAAAIRPDPNFHQRFEQEAAQFAQHVRNNRIVEASKVTGPKFEKWSRGKAKLNDPQIRLQMGYKFIELLQKGELSEKDDFSDAKHLDKVYKLVTGDDPAPAKKPNPKKPARNNARPASVRESIQAAFNEARE